MERETPVELRKSLEVVEFFKKSGIGFVPMPVLNEKDRASLIRLSQNRIEHLANKIDEEHHKDK